MRSFSLILYHSTVLWAVAVPGVRAESHSSGSPQTALFQAPTPSAPTSASDTSDAARKAAAGSKATAADSIKKFVMDSLARAEASRTPAPRVYLNITANVDTMWQRWLARRERQYRTSFVVNGAVQTALASGAGQTPLTGSLGILHDTPKEHLKALIAVANNGDSVAGVDGAEKFASSLLSQGTAGVGKGAGVVVDYSHYFGDDVCNLPSPLDTLHYLPDTNAYADSKVKIRVANENEKQKNDLEQRLAGYVRDSLAFKRCQKRLDVEVGRGIVLHQRKGYHGTLGISKSTWTDTSIKKPDTLANSSNLVALAITTNYSWLVINHPEDEKNNSFSFFVEGGLAARGILGDLADGGQDSLRVRALGTKGKWFAGIDVAPSIQLHQVTAYAMITCLWNLRGGKNSSVRGLTGVQAILGFTFDAPLYTY